MTATPNTFDCPPPDYTLILQTISQSMALLSWSLEQLESFRVSTLELLNSIPPCCSFRSARTINLFNDTAGGNSPLKASTEDPEWVKPESKTLMQYALGQ